MDTPSTPLTFGGVSTTTPAEGYITTGTTISSTTNPFPSIPMDPGILWGAAATALLGATLAEWERERKRQEAEEAEAEKRANIEKRKAQKAHEDAVRERWAEEARQERVNNASTARWEGLAKIEEAKKQAKINDANAARWAGVAVIAQAKEKEKEKAAYEQRMGEHGYDNVNVGGPKVLAVPVQEEKPKWWEKITNAVGQAWDTTKETVTGALNMTKTIGTDFVNLLVETGKSISNSFTQTVVPVLSSMKTDIQNTLISIRDGTKKTWEKIKQKVDNNIIQPVKDIWNNRTSRISLLLGATAVTVPILYLGINSIFNTTYDSNVGTLFGIEPDYNGINIALQNKTDIELITNLYNLQIQNGEINRQVPIDPIMIEAAFAVQNQWNIALPWGLGDADSLIAQFRPNSSTGLAQLTENDLKNENLQLLVPAGTIIEANNPYVATAGMIERIAPVVELCDKKECSPIDQIIAVSMAQNGNGFTERRLAEVLNNYESNGQINWEEFFEQQGPKVSSTDSEITDKFLYHGYNIKAVPGNFDTEFMAQRYFNNLRELHNEGVELPAGITEEDLNYADCLVNNLNVSPSLVSCPRP